MERRKDEWKDGTKTDNSILYSVRILKNDGLVDEYPKEHLRHSPVPLFGTDRCSTLLKHLAGTPY